MDTMTTRASRGAWRTFFSRAVAAVALFVGAAFGASDALAGDAVKLAVEMASDITEVEAGESVDVQIVGIDSTGSRVVIKDVETSATYGNIVLVKAPYQFRYTAPTDLPDTTKVRIIARLKATPEIQGEMSIPVLPPVAYKRLILTGPGTTPGGLFVDFVLTGETPAGVIEPVKEATVKVAIASGPGTITFLRTGRYRYEAAANASGTAKITATLTKHPKVTTSAEILVVSATGGGTPPTVPPTVPPVTPPSSGGSSGGNSGGGSSGGGTGGTGGTGSSGGNSGGNSGGGATPPAVDGVVWSGGALKLTVWRTRQMPETDWAKADEKKLPKAGEELGALAPQQRVRLVYARTDIAKVECEEWVGKKGTDIKRIDPSKDGRFQLDINKGGNRIIILECNTPENGTPVTMSLLVTLNDGKIIREDFVFRRGEKAPEKGDKK